MQTNTADPAFVNHQVEHLRKKGALVAKDVADLMDAKFSLERQIDHMDRNKGAAKSLANKAHPTKSYRIFNQQRKRLKSEVVVLDDKIFKAMSEINNLCDKIIQLQCRTVYNHVMMLPRELRDMIYKLIICHQDPISISAHVVPITKSPTKRPSVDKVLIDMSSKKSREYEPYVSWNPTVPFSQGRYEQITNELVETYYRENTFQADDRILKDFLEKDTIWHSTIAPKQCILKISVRCSVDRLENLKHLSMLENGSTKINIRIKEFVAVLGLLRRLNISSAGIWQQEQRQKAEGLLVPIVTQLRENGYDIQVEDI
ncbi:hypothetical protein P154DRAFT_621697 [Amniculicola lignicola CBS 123094]|uniref:Uncharacterized protein n=1 Tax=Amniculicola lignicola CBS 123094 TaxID=1392246 RepID=A0A6A5W9K0_9PLEO|nr:hypothetical protein P154DRAFT_621697 [Amniculicola lignicola CBS 123094]